MVGYIAVLFHLKIGGYYPDTDFTNLLGVLLAFLGLVGGGIYLWISKMVKEDIENDRKEERALSKAEMAVLFSSVNMLIYKTFYIEKTKSEDIDGEAKKQIEHALNMIRKAIECFNEVGEGRYPRERLINKNNLAYYLARKWNYYREKQSDEDFQKYLETDIKRAKEYTADKRMAEICITDIKNTKDLEKFPDIIGNTEDTALWVERVFSTKSTLSARL